ncbi:MAG: hypothetical protein KGH98_01725 [Candidatus Micrarchaeota archaeon]|nr:hypothetical protein [Candidatus Micrarchaeota archaeon]
MGKTDKSRNQQKTIQLIQTPAIELVGKLSKAYSDEGAEMFINRGMNGDKSIEAKVRTKAKELFGRAKGFHILDSVIGKRSDIENGLIATSVYAAVADNKFAVTRGYVVNKFGADQALSKEVYSRMMRSGTIMLNGHAPKEMDYADEFARALGINTPTLNQIKNKLSFFLRVGIQNHTNYTPDVRAAASISIVMNATHQPFDADASFSALGMHPKVVEQARVEINRTLRI